MIYLGAGDDFKTDIIQTPHTGTCRWDDLLLLAQEYKFTFILTERCGKHAFLWFLPPALMTCFSSAKTHTHALHSMCSIQQKKTARINVVSVAKKRAENRPFSHFLGDHDNRFREGDHDNRFREGDHDNQFRHGQFEKPRRNLEKGQTEKNSRGEPGGIYLQRTVSTRGLLLLLLLPRSGWAGAEI